jgi:tetratricopeptide (TPR) repeat protein
MEGKMTGSAESSIQTYREMLRLDPRSRVFTLLAEELCAAGEWEQVAQVCKEGLIYHPENLRSRVLLGWALMEMGQADQSEEILLQVVDDIRKNVIIFKMLSEFATFSGNPVSAAEYAGIYTAFQTPGAAGGEPARPEPVSQVEKEAKDWNDFKAEAIEELQGPDLQVVDGEMPVKIGVDDFLLHLAQRIEGRFAGKIQLPAIFSEQDKSFLKQELIAALTAD